MFIVGVDPGADGGIAMIHSDGTAYSGAIFDDVELQETIQLAKRLDNVMFIIEDVHAICNSGAKATFNFGRNVGRAQGIALANKLKLNKVLPPIWKKEFGLVVEGGKDIESCAKKQASIDKAKELFPNININLRKQYEKDRNGKFVTEKKQVGKKIVERRVFEYIAHDGVAEALLIAEYGRRHLSDCVF